MRTHRKNLRQRGAALVIGLILLAVITLLAVVGMNISNSELASATSEQLRLRSFQAAETGVEYAMVDEVRGYDVRHTDTSCHAFKITPVTPVNGSPINSATGLPTDQYTSKIQYMTDSAITDGYSGSKFTAYHYAIESIGTSSRNAIFKSIQGTYTVNQSGSGGGESFSDINNPCSVPVVGAFSG